METFRPALPRLRRRRRQPWLENYHPLHRASTFICTRRGESHRVSRRTNSYAPRFFFRTNVSQIRRRAVRNSRRSLCVLRTLTRGHDVKSAHFSGCDPRLPASKFDKATAGVELPCRVIALVHRECHVRGTPGSRSGQSASKQRCSKACSSRDLRHAHVHDLHHRNIGHAVEQHDPSRLAVLLRYPPRAWRENAARLVAEQRIVRIANLGKLGTIATLTVSECDCLDKQVARGIGIINPLDINWRIGSMGQTVGRTMKIDEIG